MVSQSLLDFGFEFLFKMTKLIKKFSSLSHKISAAVIPGRQVAF